jgi:hypothetical protein
MDEMGPELKKRANQLYRHNLTGFDIYISIIPFVISIYFLKGMLEGALRSSNAQFEPSYVLDRIGVRLLEPSPGNTHAVILPF